MKLALCQMRMSADEQTNLERGLDALHRAAAAGADLIVYPELQLHLFFPQYEGRDAADKLLTLESPIVRQFQDACRAEGIMAAPNFYLREAGGCFDTTILIGADGALIGRQKMVHIAQAEQFYEQDYYTPSDDGFKVFNTPFGRVGIVICYDRHLPESIRTCTLMGAQLVIIPRANTKAEPMEMFEWEIRVQAMQNQVFIAMCNRVGKEGDMDFAGESIVVHPSGDVICKVDDKERLVCCEIDLAASDAWRAKKPYIPTRRPECYL